MFFLSSELKDALSNIIHLSTLKTLNINGITKVSLTFLLPVVHLTTLELHSISPNDFYDENSSSLTPAALKGVAPVASHTVIQVDRQAGSDIPVGGKGKGVGVNHWQGLQNGTMRSMEFVGQSGKGKGCWSIVQNQSIYKCNLKLLHLSDNTLQDDSQASC